MKGREALYSAFFTQLSTALQSAGVVTVSRRLKHWADVPAAQQPAVFQCQADEEPHEQRGQPTRWYLNLKLWVYVNVGSDQNAVPATFLNPILDAIEAAFPQSPASGYQSIGGLIWEQGGKAFNICFEGTETFEGVLGPQEVAVVRVKITAL